MLLVAVFEDHTRAQKGVQALHALHARGAVTVYAHALLERDRRHGRLHLREPFRKGTAAVAPAATALAGALESLVGGAGTVALPALESGLVGTVRDLVDAGIDPAFLEEVVAALQLGSFGVIAEATLEDPLPLECAMASLGARMALQDRHDLRLEEQLTREAEMLRRSQGGQAPRPMPDPGGAAVSAMAGASLANLRRGVERARRQAGALRREAVAKVAVLRAQATLADGPARQQVQVRAAAIRTELEEAARRLDRLVEEVGLRLPDAPGRPRR